MGGEVLRRHEYRCVYIPNRASPLPALSTLESITANINYPFLAGAGEA